MNTCKYCGSDCPPTKNGNNKERKYCSTLCSTRYHTLNRLDRQPKKIDEVEELFIPRLPTNVPIYGIWGI